MKSEKNRLLPCMGVVGGRNVLVGSVSGTLVLLYVITGGVADVG